MRRQGRRPRPRALRGLLAALAAAGLAAAPAGAGAQSSSAAPSARALADSLEEGVTRAALRGDRERLAELRRLAARARELHPDDPWIRHYLGYTLYRIGLQEVSDGGPRAADSRLARAQAVLEASAREDSIPESLALLAATLGIRIGADPARRARTMGPEAGWRARAAAAAGPENPRVWLIRGIDAFHAPARFGGGVEEARRHLEKALALFRRRDVEAPAPGWGRAEAHAYLGRVHARQGRREEARAAYREALDLAPGYAWVEDELLPALREGGGGDG